MSWSRAYGYFRCRECGNRWESAHVYCYEGTENAAFGQECKKCRVSCMPFQVENLTCSTCKRENCTCKSKRHLDPRKAHPRDLCDKCNAGFPCPDEGQSWGGRFGTFTKTVLIGAAFILVRGFLRA